METELHVAQHSRREKLRVQNVSNGEIYTTHFDQEGNHLTSDFAHLRSFRYGNMPYEPLVFPSPEAVNFGLDSKDVSAMMLHQGSVDSSAKASSGAPQSCSTWKNIADTDWIADGNPNPGFDGGSSLKSNYNEAAAAASMYGMKPSFQDYNASSLYHNPMVSHQEMGYVAISQQNNREGSSVSWANGGNGNELVLLPSYADRGDQHCDSINRQVDERYHRWNGDLQVYSENKNGDRDGSNTQALSLSLSSIPLCNDRMVPENLHSGSAGGGYGNMINNQDVKIMKSEQLCFDVKGSCNNGKSIEGHQHNVVGNSSVVTSRSVGPLGPFTGYATILKSSRFLKPAQQLLDEFCNMLGPKSAKISHLESPDPKLSNQTNRNDSTDMNATDSINVGGAFGGDSGGSSSTFYSSNNNNNSEKAPEFGGLSSSTHETYRPEFLQKKAKLLYMLEEVCRRYKQYNQQMQMVVSAFETVAGLSAATPYISQALKSISRHFRCLRTAISDQLKSVRKALGEDLLSPTTGTSCSSKGGDTSISSRLKLMDQALHMNQKAPGGGTIGFFEAQQHVWRPQRGLPERAVAILRAWLFDHFLHPYPTDADKHMLATQTGLSRNQVSNWFINARVRVWKPMVEEIHMLETKGSPETNSTVGNTDLKANHGTVGVTNIDHNHHIQSSSNGLMNTGGFAEKQVEYPAIGSSGFGTTITNMDDWNLKRSRAECHTGPGGTTVDGSLVGFAPYQQAGIDIGSLGAVSLTLGLRRNADGVQQPHHHHHHHHHAFQQQHQQPPDHNQLRRHYGDQIIYDFVG